MKIINCENSIDALLKCKTALREALARVLNEPVLFMVSGGSAIELLLDMPFALLGSHMTIGLLDERYSKEVGASNSEILQATDFYKKAVREEVSFIGMNLADKESLEDAAKSYDNDLKEWRRLHKESKVIITQGVGEDGHTAGIMPYPENPERFKQMFMNDEVWVAGYDATVSKNKFPLRITATISFLRNQVDKSIAYAVGKSKEPALEKIALPNGTLWETPARVMREMKDVKVVYAK